MLPKRNNHIQQTNKQKLISPFKYTENVNEMDSGKQCAVFIFRNFANNYSYLITSDVKTRCCVHIVKYFPSKKSPKFILFFIQVEKQTNTLRNRTFNLFLKNPAFRLLTAVSFCGVLRFMSD